MIMDNPLTCCRAFVAMFCLQTLQIRHLARPPAAWAAARHDEMSSLFPNHPTYTTEQVR